MASELKGAAAKLAHIQATIGDVDKTGRNDHQKFQYFQEHGVFGLLKPYQRDLKVAVIVDFVNQIEHEDNMTTLVARLRFIDTEEPADSADRTIEAGYPIQATDNQGWGAAKAQTYGSKFALQKFFQIPTEELPEAESQSVPKTRQSPSEKSKSTASSKADVRKQQMPLEIAVDLLGKLVVAKGIEETQKALAGYGIELPDAPMEKQAEQLRTLTKAQAKALVEWANG